MLEQNAEDGASAAAANQPVHRDERPHLIKIDASKQKSMQYLQNVRDLCAIKGNTDNGWRKAACTVRRTRAWDVDMEGWSGISDARIQVQARNRMQMRP